MHYFYFEAFFVSLLHVFCTELVTFQYQLVLMITILCASLSVRKIWLYILIIHAFNALNVVFLLLLFENCKPAVLYFSIFCKFLFLHKCLTINKPGLQTAIAKLMLSQNEIVWNWETGKSQWNHVMYWVNNNNVFTSTAMQHWCSSWLY